MSYSIWEGEKIKLRAIESKDADFFYHWNFDDDVIRRIDEIHFPQSYERVKEWAEKESKATPEDGSFKWIAETKEGKTVGSINTFECNRRVGTFYYGIGVARDQWGNGYAQEMIHLVLRYYFYELNYQKVTVLIYSFNDRSKRLHEKFGFQKEGELRNMYLTNGNYYNELFYGMTREEYRDKYGGPADAN
ncbi:MAG TPA: GNAT family protein [Bacillales bacterium]|nr:GNAT family protein [Bacillales bacterium]